MIYIFHLERSSHEENEKDLVHAQGDPGKKKERQATSKRKVATVFSHPWLAGTLKSHSSSVLGIDFSPNRKYLISWSEGKH